MSPVHEVKNLGRLSQAFPIEPMPFKVVYADTDAMGVVYHARYLDIAERSRTEFVASAGIDLGQIEAEHGIWLLVNRVRADYRRPVLLHETAMVTTQVLKSGASQVWWRSQLHVGAHLAANIDVATACFDTKTKEPCVMPADLAARIATLTQPTEPS
ncbi:thioesterase family protein [Sulfitobacter sp. F26204]|uniref:acyl-CoA thioesterase n=1 Tax=Sulfitobacter sp. F26204 TaxID=2996014 RepID=UPI00225E50BA|nr:thioesterase family protein [Sulfitobacter sp. F26204]MCX7560544.1 thioesterase family protein [Sulfitobacter sp. F26204]